MKYKDTNIVGGICAILLVFSACGSSQQLDKAPPTAWSTPYLQQLATGFQLVITLQESTPLVLDSIYFRNRQVKLQSHDIATKTYIGFFEQETTDLIMSSDPHKEYANQLPAVLSRNKSPFTLGPTECVVGYFQGTRKRYTKYTGIQEKTMNSNK